MTKFEEELFNKVPCKFELTTEAEYKKSTLINHFKNWHSDEEFQELLEQNAELTRENNIVNQINSKLESQIIGLKSQLQQQALPVVPECVAKQIERVKNSNGNFATLGLFDWNHEAKPDYTKWIHENVFDFMRACTIGYTVEKPQMFYIELPNVYGLKNKVSVSKVENGTIVEFSNGKNYTLKLTEQEIKSIDERYWQFAVPVEDGE